MIIKTYLEVDTCLGAFLELIAVQLARLSLHEWAPYSSSSITAQDGFVAQLLSVKASNNTKPDRSTHKM